MIRSLDLAALLPLTACTGVSSNGGMKIYGEITTGMETERTTSGR